MLLKEVFGSDSFCSNARYYLSIPRNIDLVAMFVMYRELSKNPLYTLIRYLHDGCPIVEAESRQDEG